MIANLIKYLLLAGLLVLLGYKSVYIEKLDEHLASTAEKQFDAEAYANDYYLKLLPVAENSIELTTLLQQVKANPDSAFSQHGHALGISSIKYFLVKGQGKITAINESDLKLTLKSADQRNVSIATEFIYGNAIRDASGLVDLRSFTNTSDLNNVSAAINKKLREDQLPPVIKSLQVGDELTFTGAIEINQKFREVDQVQVIPISLVKTN